MVWTNSDTVLFEKACYKAALGMWGMRCAALQQGFEDLRQKAIYLSNLSHPLLKVRYGLMSHTTVFYDRFGPQGVTYEAWSRVEWTFAGWLPTFACPVKGIHSCGCGPQRAVTWGQLVMHGQPSRMTICQAGGWMDAPPPPGRRQKWTSISQWLAQGRQPLRTCGPWMKAALYGCAP